MKAIIYSSIVLSTLFASCSTEKGDPTAPAESTKPVALFQSINTNYRLVAAKDSIKNIDKYYNDAQLLSILAINRTDQANIIKLDSILVPADVSGQVSQYTPYPQTLPFLQNIKKIVFFSYPAQYFAAYENGVLVRSAQTNMGREKDQTPTGVFYTNWKAEETKSTFNDEWELKWNFNIQNKEGVGWHQYALPGYPASHSCLRLTEADAKYLYDWADQWMVKGTDEILASGTPVIVFGQYPFGTAKPWLKLAQNPHALDITAAQLEQEAKPFINDIQEKQQQRTSQVTAQK